MANSSLKLTAPPQIEALYDSPVRKPVYYANAYRDSRGAFLNDVKGSKRGDNTQHAPPTFPTPPPKTNAPLSQT